MKRYLGAIIALAGIAGLVTSCAAGSADEGVGAISYGLSKCQGGKLNDSNYCSPDCKCDLGEGDCDGTADCNIHPTLGQLTCAGHTIYFGGTKDTNACAPLHCANKKMDGDETQVDCGGSCGTNCPNACANLPANGTTLHCSTACRCPAGQGDCDANDLECVAGAYCAQNVGNSFGFASTVDVCLSNTCRNGVQDPDELGLDCGPTCLPCSGGSTLALARGGSGTDHGLGVALDSAAGITIAGRFGGTSSFGGGSFTASGGADIFVARYNNAATHVWSRSFGGNQADGDLGVSVAVDAARNVYLAGNYRGTVDFGGASFTHTAIGNSDAFVVKLNANGVTQWSRSFGGAPAATRINGIAVTATGDVYLAGAFASPTVNVGGTTLTNAGATGTYDAFIAKFNTSGTRLWARGFGSTGADQASSVAIDAVNQPYASASFVGTVEGQTSAGGQDALLLKLNASTGATTWARRLGAGSDDSASSLAVDSVGPVLGGNFKNTVTFPDSSTATSGGATGAFVVAYDASGEFRWKKAYVSVGADRTLTMAGSTAGVVALGDFQGSVDFGGTTGPKAAIGTRDMWAVRYNPAGNELWTLTFNGNDVTSPLGATVLAGMLGVTGDFTGSVDFGTGNAISSAGSTDAFFTRLVY